MNHSIDGIMGTQPQKVGRSDAGNVPRPEYSLIGDYTMPHSTPSASCVKTCTKCGETKPATTEYFNLLKKGKYGLNPVCTLCRRAYYLENRQREVERSRKFYLENGERVRERMRLYFEENRKAILARNRAYRATHRDESVQRNRMYYVANRERMNKQAKEWRQANPELCRVFSYRKRAWKQNAQGTHTADDIRRQHKSQRGRCYYCQCKVGDKYHVDHVVPLSRGGSNGPENLVIACPKCNMEKQAKLPHEWPQGGRLL